MYTDCVIQTIEPAKSSKNRIKKPKYIHWMIGGVVILPSKLLIHITVLKNFLFGILCRNNLNNKKCYKRKCKINLRECLRQFLSFLLFCLHLRRLLDIKKPIVIRTRPINKTTQKARTASKKLYIETNPARKMMHVTKHKKLNTKTAS